MTDQVARYYTGPHDRVTVVLDDESEVEVERGGLLHCSPELAERLDAQNDADQDAINWVASPRSKLLKAVQAAPKPFTPDEAAAAAQEAAQAPPAQPYVDEDVDEDVDQADDQGDVVDPAAAPTTTEKQES
jgi:hypothetical protein